MHNNILDNVYFLALVAFPGIMLACALISQVCQWTFSWTDLIWDYVGGVVVGLCFYYGTEKKPHEVAQFFLIFSQGLPGVLHVAGVKAFMGRHDLFMISTIWMGGSLVLASLLDLATRKIGLTMNVGSGLLSILIAPLKLPFSLCTTGVGMLFLLAGVFWYIVKKAQEDKKDPATTCRVAIGILGGVPFVEWDNEFPKPYAATTIGAMFNVWKGQHQEVVKHELFHTRQYMYFHDWMIPCWLLGGLWGMISAAIANATKNPADPDISILRSFFTADRAKEVGNPMEQAAYTGGDA